MRGSPPGTRVPEVRASEVRLELRLVEERMLQLRRMQGDAERRHERQVAQQRLDRIQRQLEHERVETAERSFGIEICGFASGNTC